MKGLDLKDLEGMDFNQMTEKLQKSARVMKLVGMSVGLIALIILFTQNWVIAIAVWLMLWGNNLEQRGKQAEAEMKKADLQKQAMKMFNGMFGGMDKERMD